MDKLSELKLHQLQSLCEPGNMFITGKYTASGDAINFSLWRRGYPKNAFIGQRSSLRAMEKLINLALNKTVKKGSTV